MEGILQFIVIAGIIAFGIFRQANKEKAKTAEERTPIPTFEYEEPLITKPTPPVAVKTPLSTQKRMFEEGVRSTYTPVASGQPTQEELQKEQEQQEDAAHTGEFSIRSTEEARRAIIWSEILQRKY